jgi:hypothetical protein
MSSVLSREREEAGGMGEAAALVGDSENSSPRHLVLDARLSRFFEPGCEQSRSHAVKHEG